MSYLSHRAENQPYFRAPKLWAWAAFTPRPHQYYYLLDISLRAPHLNPKHFTFHSWDLA